MPAELRSLPPRRFGWLPSANGAVALPKGKRLASPGIAVRLRRDDKPIAPEADLERFVECAAQWGPGAELGEDPIFNQAVANACVGNAGSQAWRIAAFVDAFRPERSNAERMALLAKVDAPSRLVGYRGARVLTGDEHVDDGTYIQCWVDYGKNRGLPPEHTNECDLTYRDDRVLEDVTNSAAVQHAANDYKLEDAYLIDDGRSKADVKIEIMSALSNDAPILFGMPLDVAFERLQPGEVYRRERPLIGRHAMVVVGYDARGVKVVNSWGPGWCFRGYGIIAWEQFLSEAADIHRCDVVPAYT